MLDEPLRGVAIDPDKLDDLVRLIVWFSGSAVHADRIQIHRLVQAGIRHRLDPSQQQPQREQVLALLTAAHPGDANDPDV